MDFCALIWLYKVQPTYTIWIKMTWVVLFSSLEHILTTIKTKFQFSYFCILYRFLLGYVNFLDPLYRGFLWIDFKFFIIHDILQSSFICGEINNCELSPLLAIGQLEFRKGFWLSEKDWLKVQLLFVDTYTTFFALYIDSKDKEQLQTNKITHILAIHDNAKPLLEVSLLMVKATVSFR